MNKNKFKIAVLCGGFEPESYASNLTGRNVLKALKNAGFVKSFKLNVDMDVVKNLQINKPDFAFLTTFCKWGEDGVIQGLLETLNIPYSGSGVETSSLCKNKFLFNRFVSGCGLYSPKNYFYGNRLDYVKCDKKIIKMPCIVKAVYQGYSLGTSLVRNIKQLNRACNVAFKFSTKITIEEYIAGREFTVGIIDIYKSKNNFERFILPIIEIKFRGTHIIQSSLVKDNPGLMEEIIPAKISSKEANKLRKQSLTLYEKLGCLGVARFDVRQSRKNNKFYFLENNTCPGILNYKQSDLPKQLKSFNISLEMYVEQMIEVGINRPENKLEQYL